MIQIKSATLLAACLISVTALAGPPRVPPQYQANLSRPVSEQVCLAARSLARLQGDFGPSGASWEWVKGSGAAENSSGLVGLALAHSARSCGGTEALERYAKSRTAAHESSRFLFDADVETLALATQVTGDAAYLATAREAFVARYGGASGREIVERWRYTRPQRQLLGYDAALAIRAALAVGEKAKAQEIAEAVLATPGWAEGSDREGWLTTSRGALLEALWLLDPAGGRNAPLRQDLVHHLLLSQASDGSFATRNTQASAYAVRGLSRMKDEAAISGATRGKAWLRLTQLGEGAWATYNDLLPEPFVGELVPQVTAEVLLALAD